MSGIGDKALLLLHVFVDAAEQAVDGGNKAIHFTRQPGFGQGREVAAGAVLQRFG